LSVGPLGGRFVLRSFDPATPRQLRSLPEFIVEMFSSVELQRFLLKLFVVVVVSVPASRGANATSTSSGGTVVTTAVYNGSTSATSYMTTSVLPTGCAAHTSCSDCVADNTCLWCPGASSCVSGDLLHNNICSDWQWQQCKIPGTYTLYGGIALICVVVLAIFICICCCCCAARRRKARAARRKVELESADEREPFIQHQESKTPKTDERRQQLMAKYGIKPKAGDFN